MRIKNILLLLLLVFTTASCDWCGERKNECFYSSGSFGSVNDSDLIRDELLEAEVFTTISNDVEQTFFGSEGGSGGGDGGTVAEFFEALINNPAYTNSLNALFTLYIIIYGLSIATGITNASTKDAIIRIAKIAVIYFILQSWDVFYNNLGQVFIEGTKELMSAAFDVVAGRITVVGECGSGGINSYTSAFSVLDCLVAQLFSVRTFEIIKAFLSAGLAGPIVLILFLFIIFYIARVLFLILIVYLVSLIARGLLFILAPVFIAFALFDRTKDMAFIWLKLVLNFSLQPVVISLAAGIFLVVMSPFINYINVINICFEDFLVIFCTAFFDLDGVNGLEATNVFDQTEGPSGLLIGAGDYPFSLVTLVFYFLASIVFFNFAQDIVKLAAYLTGSRTSGGFSLNIGGAASSVQKLFK